MTPEQLEKLHKFLQDPDLYQNLVALDDQERIHLFGRYTVSGSADQFSVTRDFTEQNRFSSAKVAVSWCIAHRAQRYDLCQRIETLDQQRLHCLNDLMQFQARLKLSRKNPWKQDLMQNRMSEAKQGLFDAHSRLRKCVNVAKYIQIRGFSDEIARTQSPKTSQPNRKGTRKPPRSFG
jgi:hypothetical protein